MPYNRVTWRDWMILAPIPAAYIGLGFWFAHNGTVEEWIYRIGLTAATFIPLIFIAIYTAFGLSKNIAAKWWRTKLGSAIVLAAFSIVPIAAPLAWVFWFNGGMLTATWLAWAEISGPAVSALAWMRVSYLWLQIHALDRVLSGKKQEEEVTSGG